MSQTTRSPKDVEPSEPLQTKMKTKPNQNQEEFVGGFRSRFSQERHGGLRAKLARAQYVLYKDVDGLQSGDSLSALNRAVSLFLKEAPLARASRQGRLVLSGVEDGSPPTKYGGPKGRSGPRS